MTAQTLTPTQFVPDGGGLDLTALLTAPTQATLQFQNTGREVLLVLPSASAETVTVDIGSLVLGEPVGNFPPVTLTSGHMYSFGPFHSVADQSGTNLMQVVLSTTASITVALVQTLGVY